MASSTAVMEGLLVSVGFNCGNRVKATGELLGLNSVQNWKKRAFYRYLVNFQTLSFINVLRNLVVYRKAKTKSCLWQLFSFHVWPVETCSLKTHEWMYETLMCRYWHIINKVLFCRAMQIHLANKKQLFRTPFCTYLAVKWSYSVETAKRS